MSLRTSSPGKATVSSDLYVEESQRFLSLMIRIFVLGWQHEKQRPPEGYGRVQPRGLGCVHLLAHDPRWRTHFPKSHGSLFWALLSIGRGYKPFHSRHCDHIWPRLQPTPGPIDLEFWTLELTFLFHFRTCKWAQQWLHDFFELIYGKAIARAYRYGQKNTCLVFKLMVGFLLIATRSSTHTASLGQKLGWR
jgi:hypothetical protein